MIVVDFFLNLLSKRHQINTGYIYIGAVQHVCMLVAQAYICIVTLIIDTKFGQFLILDGSDVCL